MKRSDAILIDEMLKYGVEEFKAKTNRDQGYLWIPLQNIQFDLGLNKPVNYLEELVLKLEEIDPCPVRIELKGNAGLEFTQATIDFLDEGGYLYHYDCEVAKEEKKEEREEVAHIVNLNSIKGNWIIYAAFILGVLNFLALIIQIVIALY